MSKEQLEQAITQLEMLPLPVQGLVRSQIDQLRQEKASRVGGPSKSHALASTSSDARLAALQEENDRLRHALRHIHGPDAAPPNTPPPALKRHESFGPEDVFESPVEWSKQPSQQRDFEALSRILLHGETMCRHSIGPYYIQAVVQDPSVSLWLVRDAKNRIFGFAITKQEAKFLDLKLICAYQRNKEGRKLFSSILTYCEDTTQELRLDAVNSKVALMYAEEAQKQGHKMFLGSAKQEVNMKRLTNYVKTMGGMIPMRFLPPQADAPESGTFNAKNWKAAMRRMHTESDEED